MNIKIEVITPTIAKEYLDKNVSNYRKISPSRVASYAKDMKLGNWEFNGEAIKFNSLGNLVDGQHRLTAIVQADVPVKMLVIYDVDNDVTIYDVAQSRNMTQLAKARGLFGDVSNGSTISAVSILLSKTWRTDYTARGQVIDYIDEHVDEIANAIKISRSGTNHGIGKRAACILATYCLLKIGKSEYDLQEFFSVVNSGFPIDNRECSAAIVLRNMMLSKCADSLSSAYKNHYIFSVVCQSFEDFEKGVVRKKAYKADYVKADKIKTMVKEIDGIDDASM